MYLGGNGFYWVAAVPYPRRGLEIHTITTAWVHNSINYPLPGRGSIHRPINTRRLLSGDDVAQLAAAYPRAVGVFLAALAAFAAAGLVA